MSKSPIITLFDLESSPLLGWAWGMYDVNILKEEQSSKVISIAYKELGKEKVYCKAICDNENYQPGDMNDEEVVRKAWQILDKSDAVITQNGIAFDERKLNTRFAYYGLNAPSSYISIDTLRIAKKEFKFDSNKLDSLGQYLGVGSKKPTGGISLWFGCMAGDSKSWSTLKEYNKEDVILLEKVYLKLRPFSKSHPNLGLIAGETNIVCGSCMGKTLTKRGFSYTMAGRKQRYQCSDCGSWTLGRYEYIKKAYKADEEDEH